MDDAEIEEERNRIKVQIHTHKSRLHFLEVNFATFGVKTNIEVKIEIVKIKTKIKYLYEKLDVLNAIDRHQIHSERLLKRALKLTVDLSEVLEDEDTNDEDVMNDSDGVAMALLSDIRKATKEAKKSVQELVRAEKEYRKL